jgi:hypothetical protein
MRTWCAKHVLLGVLLLAPGVLRAQVAAAISGHIEDPTGVGVGSATVTVKSLETGEVRTVTTDATGNFEPFRGAGLPDKVEKTGAKRHSKGSIWRWARTQW